MTLTAKPHAFAGAILTPKHARELTPSLCLAITSALAEQAYRKDAIPYTSWITEAWRVLGWSEPSAALFWEITTMYHTLYLASRAHASDFQEPNHIPPILSCGSTSSMGSGTTHQTDRPMSFDKKKFSTSASAKELPVWLVGTFLLLHCEEVAYLRNLSGQDERRFYGGNSAAQSSGPEGSLLTNGNAKADFTSLLKNPSLSPRTRLHAGWNNDNSHCTAYLLRQLRKILLLSAVSHNPDAVRACMHLAAIPSPAPTPPSERTWRPSWKRYSAEEIHRQHDDEHGNVGLSVRLNMEDLERLHFLLQQQAGGGIDDPPLKIGDYLWSCLYGSPVPPTASIPIGDVEREVRRHLELELLMTRGDQDDKEDISTDDEEATSSALANLALTDKAGKDRERTKRPPGYYKELSYMRLRGTTILLKPQHHEASSGASASSGEHHVGSTMASNVRLHDLVISDCSDVHMYLLQPFEHVTLAACTNCTVVVGAVAGMLHVVDCEKTKITSAARRILVSNSSDVQLNVFTPSPPLLVGDNRTCQLAPYNTYYDGLREDLLATGLGAAVLQENHSPFHGSRGADTEGAWPSLQCASNKWKQPLELSKLEVPQVPLTGGNSPGGSPTSPTGSSSPGADDKAVSGGKPGTGNDPACLHAPILLPASEFQVLFVPWENEAARQRRLETKTEEAKDAEGAGGGPMDSQYCRLLAEVLQLSPFHLPSEYERRVLVLADRMRNIQQAMQKNLTEEQLERFEEELNRGFREWLVSSGNLRQVLDLFQLEKREGL